MHSTHLAPQKRWLPEDNVNLVSGREHVELHTLHMFGAVVAT